MVLLFTLYPFISLQYCVQIFEILCHKNVKFKISLSHYQVLNMHASIRNI